jgi:hypothetical protein
MIIFLGACINIYLLDLAGVVGARQSNEYLHVNTEVSGLAFIFWLGIIYIFCVNGKSFISNNLFSFSAVSLYLITYFYTYLISE